MLKIDVGRLPKDKENFMNGDILIFSGNANKDLAQKICQSVGLSLSNASVGRFSEGEIQVKVNVDVRGKDVFVVQPMSYPVNESCMELFILIDALRRASARRITAVVPYFAYARQDRKDQPRVPITAKLIANMLTVAGTNRVLTMDLHADQIQGFFDIPLDNLYGYSVFLDHFKKMKLDGNLVVVSPDIGGIKRSRQYADRLGAEMVVIDKKRYFTGQTEVMNILGEVKGQNVVIVDDLVATGGSLVQAAEALKKEGAKDIYAAITHPVLSGPAIERIKASPIKKLLVTNTIPIPEQKMIENIEIVCVGSLFAEAIKRIHREESISALFI